MGLASFNRMRRERKPVEALETERFKEDNAARWGRKRNQDRQLHKGKRRYDEIREEERKASERIGEKNEIAAASPVPNIDDPLKRDHAAQWVGANVKGAQKTKDPMERLNERIPDGRTVSEDLADTTGVDTGPSPTPELVEASRREQTETDEETGARTSRRRHERERIRDDDQITGARTKRTGDRTVERVREREADESADDNGETNHGISDEERSAVRIPTTWKAQKAAKKRAIAEKLGHHVNNASEAEDVIEAELKRREAQESGAE